jgi:hypothetical protein
MASGKKSAEEGREEAPPVEPQEERGIPREAQAHLIRAGSEFALAMEEILRSRGMPEEVREHAHGMKREGLLMLRAMIDADLKRCERSRSKSGSERVRKIEVE